MVNIWQHQHSKLLMRPANTMNPIDVKPPIKGHSCLVFLLPLLLLLLHINKHSAFMQYWGL